MPTANLPQGGGLRQVCNHCGRFEAQRAAQFEGNCGNSSLVRFFCDGCVSNLDIWDRTLALSPEVSPSGAIQSDAEFWRLVGPLLSSVEKDVYMAMVHVCTKRREPTTNRELLQQASCHERTLKRAKRTLENAGLIVCVERPREGVRIFIVRPRKLSGAEVILIRPSVYSEAVSILKGEAGPAEWSFESEHLPNLTAPANVPAAEGGGGPAPFYMQGGGGAATPFRPDTLSLNYIYACKQAGIGSTSERGGARVTPCPPELITEVRAAVSAAWPSYKHPSVWQKQITKLAGWLQDEGIKPKARILIRFLLHQANDEQLCARDAKGQLRSKLHVATTRDEFSAWLEADKQRAAERAAQKRSVRLDAEHAARSQATQAESVAAGERAIEELRMQRVL